MWFKAQSKLSGFPLLSSRLVFQFVLILRPEQILHFPASDGNRAHTENHCGSPNLMGAKFLALDKKPDTTQELCKGLGGVSHPCCM